MTSSQDPEATQAFSSGQLEVDLPEFVSWLESGTHRATDNPDFKPEYVRVFVQALRHRRYLYASSIPGDSPAAEVHANVLAISQDTDSIGYDVRLHGEDDGEVKARLMFDPSSDALIVTNASLRFPIHLEGPGGLTELLPARSGMIAPGTWRLMCQKDAPLLQLQVLPRQSWVEDKHFAEGSSKRRRESDEQGSKRQRDESSSAISRPFETAIASAHHPLLTLTQGQTACLVGPGSKETYTITHSNRLIDTRGAKLYSAVHSNVTSPVVVKVIKALPGQAAEVRRSAEIWLREVKIHARVQHHPSIIRFYGCDARFYSLYIEHEHAVALDRNPWCGSDNKSTCDVTAARTILVDMAQALQYLHSRHILHNDIKPANILFRATRGAVLIDFGLGSTTDDPVHNGGSPWYLPPEYLALNLRGGPGDVFALGVTMLWVLRKCRLPETYQSWAISKINSAARSELPARTQARRSMAEWLETLEGISAIMSCNDRELGEVVQLMVSPDRNRRITAEEITRRLT